MKIERPPYEVQRYLRGILGDVVFTDRQGNVIGRFISSGLEPLSEPPEPPTASAPVSRPPRPGAGGPGAVAAPEQEVDEAERSWLDGRPSDVHRQY